MALLLVLLGLFLMLFTVYNGIGLFLLIVGLVFFFVAPAGPYAGPRRWPYR